MTIRQILFKMFEANETAKLTDSELKNLIRKDIPDSLLDVPLSTHTDRLAMWRSEYNRGRLGTKPKVFSFSYNRDKRPCNRYGHDLTPKEIAKRLNKFKSRWKDSNARHDADQGRSNNPTHQ